MFRFVAVLPLTALSVGEGFSLSAWPLHVTLVSNFATELDAAAIGRILGDVLTGELPPTVRVGDEALFGRFENVRVSLVERTTDLDRVHSRSVAALANRGVAFDDPDYLGEGYRPHVTRTKRARAVSGDQLVLSQLALVDMAPAGDSGHRRVVWAQTLGSLL